MYSTGFVPTEHVRVPFVLYKSGYAPGRDLPRSYDLRFVLYSRYKTTLTVVVVSNPSTVTLTMTVMNLTGFFADINVVYSVNLFGFVNPGRYFEVFARYTELALVLMYGYIEVFNVTGFVIANMFRVISFN